MMGGDRLGVLLALWCCFCAWLVLLIVWAISRPLCGSVWILGAVILWGCDGMEVSRLAGAASFPGRLVNHDGAVILWA